jgi:2-(3-amino-3-carboxypropyl)histidine synthase
VAELIQNAKNLNILKSEFKPPCALGLLTNIQFITQIDKVINILENVKYQVWVGTGDDRIKHPGQVLGCNFSAARAIDDKVKGFLFIGDGMFHPLGVALATNKRVLTYNPIDNKFQDTAELRDKILRQRSGAISALKDAINFGILVSTKSGQNRMELAKKIQNKLKLNDRNGALLTLDTITPTQVDYLPFDGYISTACPRLAIDDFIQYKKPIITPIELEIILGERSWENYAFDEIIE